MREAKTETPAPKSKSPSKAGDDTCTCVDSSYLETLLGYNTRRAMLTISSVFFERMSVYGLRMVDFSILSLIAHNSGITSRQLCTALDILPPNLVTLIANFDKRQLIERRVHQHDKRALGLHLTPEGKKLLRLAEKTATDLELEACAKLSEQEVKTLMQLLQKLYLSNP